MDMQLEMLVKMRDQLSKPLTDQQKALKGVNQQIKDLIKTQKDKERADAKAKKAAEEWSKAVGEEMTAAAGAAASYAAIAAAGVLAFAAALVYATSKVVEFVTAQGALGEKLAASYTLFTRDAAAAEQTRDMIDQLANRMHIAPDKLHDTAHELLAAGIKPQLELQRSVRAVSELQKTGNEAAAAKLKGILSRGAATRRQFGGAGFVGITKAEAIETLGATGWEDIQKAIAARGGKAIRTGYTSLMTTADTMNAALADAVTGGKIGAAARNMMGGFPEVIVHLQTVLRGLFQSISKTEGFREFIGALHSAIDALEMLGKQGSGKNSATVLSKGFHLLALGVNKALVLTLHLVIYTLKFANAVAKAYIAIRKWLAQGDRMNTLKAALMGVGFALAAVLITVALLAAAFAVLWVVVMLPMVILVGLFAMLGIAIYKVTSHFKTWKAEATDAVAGLIDGLVSGIRKGVTAVLDASKTLGKTVLDGVKQSLAIQSPSREMMKLGALSAQGFQGGLDSAGGFTIGGITSPALAVGGGARGGSIGDVSIEVIVQGGANVGADELKPLMTDAFADALERVQLEYGGG